MPRIASLLSSATEMVCGLGLEQHLVAISHECDYPPTITHLPRATRTRIDPALDSQSIDDAVRAALSAGEPLYDVNAELLARLAPELIVTQAQCDVCAVRLADVEAIVARFTPANRPQVLAAQPQLAGRCATRNRNARRRGRRERSRAYVASLNSRIERVRQSAAAQCLPPRRVAIIEWIEPLMLSGNWLPELVGWAGGEHALTTPGEHSPYVAWEQVAVYDPEVVIVAPCGFDLERTRAEALALLNLPGWRELAAFKQGRVFALDGNAYLNRSGPRLVDSLEILAHLIYPERTTAPACVPRPESVWRRLE